MNKQFSKNGQTKSISCQNFSNKEVAQSKFRRMIQYLCVGLLTVVLLQSLGPNTLSACELGPYVEGPFYVASQSPFGVNSDPDSYSDPYLDPDPDSDGSCGLECAPGLFYPPNAETDALIAVNPKSPNNIVCAFMQDHCVGTSIAISDDYGDTWSEVLPPELSPCTGGDDECYGDQSIAVEPNGTMHLVSVAGDMTPEGNPVTWTDEVIFDVKIIANRSTDSGKTWSEPVVISPKGQYQHNGIVAVDPKIPGRIYSAWCTNTTNPSEPDNHYLEDGFAYVSRSDDSGLTWGYPVKVTPITYITDLRVLNDGSIVLATENDTVVSKDDGSTWSKTRPLGIQYNTFMFPHPDARDGLMLFAGERPLAVGPAGELYQVGTVIDADAGTGEVLIAKSLNKGKKWKTSKVVTESAGYVWGGSCAVTPDGNIGVMWYDTSENVLGDGKITTRVNFAVSKDDGDSWTTLEVSELFDMNKAAQVFGGFLYLGNYQSVVPLGMHNFALGFAVAPPVALTGGSDIQFARVIVPYKSRGKGHHYGSKGKGHNN